jgi:hypothetical protein
MMLYPHSDGNVERAEKCQLSQGKIGMILMMKRMFLRKEKAI